MNRLTKLPAGFVFVSPDSSYLVRHACGASCRLIPPTNEPGFRDWLIVNETPNGSRWCHVYPSFKQAAEALNAE